MYQVWTKSDEYSGWQRKDCEDLAVAQAEILLAVRAGKEPLLTQEIPIEISVKIKEDKVSEVDTSKAKPGEGPGAKGKSKVRPGDTSSVPELS